jgi:hypothetical protein
MYLFINDRSNLDEIVCLIPKGHKENPTDKTLQVSLREELNRREFHRNDIVLVNNTHSGREYCLYVTKDGFCGDLLILDFLKRDELEKIEEIATKMRQNAIDFPPAEKLLS